jgi:hypothetical protein
MQQQQQAKQGLHAAVHQAEEGEGGAKGVAQAGEVQTCLLRRCTTRCAGTQSHKLVHHVVPVHACTYACGVATFSRQLSALSSVAKSGRGLLQDKSICLYAPQGASEV